MTPTTKPPPRNKREARVARRLEKQLRQQEKSARFRERPENLEAVRVAAAPRDRSIRLGANPGSIYQMMMEWTHDYADRKGEWSWGQARDWGYQAWSQVIRPKLAEFEKLKWAEIEAFLTGTGHRMHHSMEVNNICTESQKRLGELGIDEEEIYRFRLGNLRRLWGFRVVNMFEILWYDPEHKIYPTDPD